MVLKSRTNINYQQDSIADEQNEEKNQISKQIKAF
jgi:hypothetical protein